MKLLTSSQSNSILVDRKWLSQYIPDNSPRYQHILGVVHSMESLLPQLNIPNDWKPSLLQACYLHDIGYSPQLNKYNFHPLDGAIFAYHQGFSKSVVAAILFHSCSFEQVQQTRHDLNNIYQENHTLLDEQDKCFIDLVTYCDLHTSSSGQFITYLKRIQDVVDRYGPSHEVSRLMLANRPYYEETIARVNKLLGHK
ncbi:HD domain-containing protein [Paenactinomyces guangxiensis]|uniref:HD domain-containing protein n=1 Tax=Paenactinomyces guangxiensis TaxID=1490290 RepID=A0A7W1WSM0_9BACL|nr:HD domain-containing protein [Paenactinomyces guangxiensis]MBA4495291.1 HD domain-containing protein [Paenactinomyces guangxiensis]MBH8592375.1 HD domain-containing protein [Paenactinomyces guangxiensis]